MRTPRKKKKKGRLISDYLQNAEKWKKRVARKKGEQKF